MVRTPQPFATEVFNNATAAVARLEDIYERNTTFLRDCFEAYANGEVINTRVRATYPFVRVTIATHARLDFTPFLRLRRGAGRLCDDRNPARSLPCLPHGTNQTF